jgi:hypothetical protein
MNEETVANVCRSMRSIAVGLREEVMDYPVPIRWTPPDDEVFAGNLDFGGGDITLADLLEVFAHLLDEGPLNPTPQQPMSEESGER